MHFNLTVFQKIKLNKTSENLKIQKVIAVIAIVLFCLKIFAWYVTNSVAILSDALESIVNILASFMGIYSLILSAKPKDKNHLYGHGKVEFISSGIEGTLIIIAGLFIIYKSIVRFNEPSEINKIDTGLILLSFTALVNWVAGTICVKKGKNSNSLVLIASGKHLQSDTITTAGIFVGLLLMYFLGYVWLDSLVAALFSLIIIYSGVKIIRSSVAGIMDETDIRLLGRLVETLNNNRSVNWMDIHNMRIIKYGATLHLDCHLTVPWYFNVNEAHAELDKVINVMHENFDESVEMFIHSDGCIPTSCPICMKMDCPVRQHEFERKIHWTINNISSNKKHNIETV